MDFFHAYDVHLFFHFYERKHTALLLFFLPNILKNFIHVVISWKHKIFSFVLNTWKIVLRHKFELVLIKIYLLNTIYAFHHIFCHIISKYSWLQILDNIFMLRLSCRIKIRSLSLMLRIRILCILFISKL